MDSPFTIIAKLFSPSKIYILKITNLVRDFEVRAHYPNKASRHKKLDHQARL